MRQGRRTAIAAALVAVLLALGAGAGTARAIPWDVGGAVPPSRTPPPARPDPDCLQSYADDRPHGGPPLVFGIGPRRAGESGTVQNVTTVPESRARRDRALGLLRGRRAFAVRLNRLFLSNGDRGIRRFKRLARQFTRRGIGVELQVRYHPRPQDDGDIGKWLRFVRQVVRTFGPDRRVTGLQITNEVNIAFSRNTSDGAYRDAVGALVRGVIEAKRTSRRLGYAGHQRIGFNYAFRFGNRSDAAFWEQVGRRGGRRLQAHTDWVGLDVYPGTYAPGIVYPNDPVVDLGDAYLESLALVRECFMPKAGLTRRTPLRVEEIGLATRAPVTEAEQRAALERFVAVTHAYRGTYNITDFRWFNLRDNRTGAPTIGANYGLLRDDYSPKPAFAAYRRLVQRLGAPPRR